jgi:broad specificity phosphatase PhoE
MVTTLYLVRHGAIEGSGVKRYHGSIDVPLSGTGIEQIRETAEFVSDHLGDSTTSKYLSYLKDIHDPKDVNGHMNDSLSKETPRLSAIYCSDLRRAVKSAEIIAESHGLTPVQVPALRERNFGIWEGMSFTEIREKYPAEFEAWAGNPLKYSPTGGESTVEVRERVVHALERIVGLHSGENISIVAHGGVNRIILCHIMGIPLENIFRIEQDYAAVNIIEFWDRYPVVKLLNGGMTG